MSLIQFTVLCALLAGDPTLEFTPHGYDLLKEVVTVSSSYDIPYNVVLSWLYQESRFDPKAVNTRNANGTTDRGVSMINSRYRDSFVAWFESKLGRKLTPYEIDEMNAQLGAFLISEYTKKYGSLTKGIARYNPGDKSYAHRVLSRSTGRDFKSEVVPAFLVAVFRKSSGTPLTLTEACALMNTGRLALS